MKNLAFFEQTLTERGTSVALYDYAEANEEICKNKSIVIHVHSQYTNPTVIRKFETRFGDRLISLLSYSQMPSIIELYKIEYLYVIKFGTIDNILPQKIPTLIHSVFAYEPHGRYACVSKNIAKKNEGVWLPHIVKPHLDTYLDFRKELQIPKAAYVYGRYGGKDTFSVDYVKKVIAQEIDLHPNVYFLFANTEQFISHPRVIFSTEIINPLVKAKFINTCDAMIHARLEGETFGLSVAEFVSARKPVLTCPAIITEDNEHINLAKEWVIVFHNENELRKLLWKIPHIVPNTKNPYEIFSAEKVMEIFWEILK